MTTTETTIDAGAGQDSKLPVPTSDLEQVKADLAEFGYAYLANGLTPDQVRRVHERILEQAECEGAAGVAYTGDGSGLKRTTAGPADDSTPWQAVRAPLNKGQVFHELALHPTVNQLMAELLGPSYILSGYNALIMRLGCQPQTLHSDLQAWLPFPSPVPLLYNVFFLITDFDAGRGGTRLIPGTHTGPIVPYTLVKNDAGEVIGAEAPDVEGVRATGPAGTILIFDGRLWHAGGANTSGKLRLAVSAAYSSPMLRQQDQLPLCLNEDVYANASEELKRLVGFATVGGGVGRIDPGTGRTNTDITFPAISEMHRS